jgi:putative transposase
MVTPATKRTAAGVMVKEFRRSQRRACALSGLGRSTCRYRFRRPSDDEFRQKLRAIAMRRPGFGYRRLGYFLRKEDGLRFNHKRLLRLYRSEGLGLPRKRPRKRLWQRPRPLVPAIRPNERWSIDFVADQLGSGRRFRVFTIMDDYTRQWPITIVDTSIGGTRLVRAFEELAKTRPLPKTLVCDNGTEFTSGAFLSWAETRGIELRFIQPGKPNQNAFVESFNGKFRLECLNAHWFSTLDDARREIEAWRTDYNDVRPHSSLGEVPPAVFAAAHRETAA